MESYSQGDSIWADIDLEDSDGNGIVFDDDWTGSWAISEKKGTAVLLSGSMSQNTDKTLFLLRIESGTTSTLTPGVYNLAAQVQNSVVKFRREKNSLITITAQTIIP